MNIKVTLNESSFDSCPVNVLTTGADGRSKHDSGMT